MLLKIIMFLKYTNCDGELILVKFKLVSSSKILSVLLSSIHLYSCVFDFCLNIYFITLIIFCLGELHYCFETFSVIND